MNIGVVGSGPATEAVTAALGDIDVTVQSLTTAELAAGETDTQVGIVVAPTGAAVFEHATTALSRWVAVEIGGFGGVVRDTLDAAVVTFDRNAGCYQCLSTRVQSSERSTDDPRGSRSAVRYAGAVAGKQLIELLTGDRAGGTVTEIDGQTRTFLPVPNCTCTSANNAKTVPTLTTATVPVTESIERAEKAVDEKVGILSQVGERESFPVPYYISMTADTTAFSDAQAAEFAAGVDVDWDRAYMKALGEGLERYCAGVYRTADSQYAPESNLRTAVSPSRFVRPDSYELPDTDTPIKWLEGRDLLTEETVSIPAECVWYPPPERRLKPAITTGLGLGNSGTEAILSGLYEVIERDATMIGWYSTFEPLKLLIEDERFTTLEKRARAESLTVTALLNTQDIDIPVVSVAVHRDTGEWPAFAMGSGADLDPVSAAVSALSEALQNWMELRAMGEEQSKRQEAAIGKYGSFPQIVRRFVDVDAPAIRAADLDTPELDGTDELATVCSQLEDVDLSAYAVRITTRDVAQLGFEAVRVLIPAAQPLFTGDPFFGDRATAVPESMGFEPRLDRPYHPYP